jgi:Domain of unknown function (DUF4276)
MQKVLSTTLVADGSSDLHTLTPIVTLLLDQHSPVPFYVSQAEGTGQGHMLEPRIRSALALFPCKLLLVHRDAESSSVAAREREIEEAIRQSQADVPYVCAVPVRMTEAWLLVDETAIRCAAGNPTGTSSLQLPRLQDVESAQAKDALFRALELASGLGARRIRGFQPQKYRHRVAEALTDLEGLRRLPSFVHFETTLVRALKSLADHAEI